MINKYRSQATLVNIARALAECRELRPELGRYILLSKLAPEL